MKKSIRNKLLFIIMIMIPLLVLYGCSNNDEDGSETAMPAQEAEVVEEDVDQEDVLDEEPANGDGVTSREDHDTEISYGTYGHVPKNYYYERTVVGGPFTRVWVQDEKERVDLHLESEGKLYAFIIYGEDYVYTFFPDTMSGIRSLRVPNQPDTNFLPKATFDYVKQNHLREETFNGVPTYFVKVHYSSDFGNEEVKEWIHRDYGLIMRHEVSGSIPGNEIVIEVNNFEVGGVTDEVFIMPEGYDVYYLDTP